MQCETTLKHLENCLKTFLKHFGNNIETSMKHMKQSFNILEIPFETLKTPRNFTEKPLEFP